MSTLREMAEELERLEAAEKPKPTEAPFCMHVPTREGCDCWQRAGRPLFGFREALARLEAYERSGCGQMARVLRIAAARRAERMAKA